MQLNPRKRDFTILLFVAAMALMWMAAKSGYRGGFPQWPARAIETPESPQAQSLEGPQPVCGVPLLPEIMPVEGGPYIEMVASAARDTVGQIRSFYAWDHNKNQFHQVAARLLKIGKFSMIYVDTSETTSEADINRLSNEFDNVIYPTTTKLFGAEPRPGDAKEIDGDSLITILLYDIRDPAYYDSSTTQFVAGYFLPNNQDRRTKFPKSNEREMVYVDIRSLSSFPDQTLGTLAHEFQHLIQWNQDATEARWVNEGLSELAIWACGYHRRSPFLFLNNPDLSLTTFQNKLEDYDKTFLFFMYLYDHFGGDSAIYAISTDPNVDTLGVVSGLKKIDPTASFRQIFENWVLANYLDMNDGSAYSYSNLELPTVGFTKVFTALPVEPQNDQVLHYAADYIEFRGGTDLVIHIDGEDNNNYFSAKIVEFDENGNVLNIRDLPLDIANEGFQAVADFGNTVKRAGLVVIHSYYSPVLTKYTYFAEGKGQLTGSQELSYDDGRPYGYFQLQQSDTLFVAFDGQEGMALDSVRFKFFTGGNAEFHIWRPRVSGLPGNDLIQPLKKRVQKVANQSNNFEAWETIDYSSQFIDISRAFLVGLVMGADAPDPKVLVDSTNVEPPRSLLFGEGSNGRQWYLASGDFMIRAYISPLINDFSKPTLTVGVFQHPVFTENLDVFLYSPKPLNPASIVASINRDGTSEPLPMSAATNDNTLFHNLDVQLQGPGTVTITVQGTHARGNIPGADSLTFTVQEVALPGNSKLTSADQQVTVEIPAGALEAVRFVTVMPLRQDRPIPGVVEPLSHVQLDGFELASGPKRIGPAGKLLRQPARLRWRVDAAQGRQAFIGEVVDGQVHLLESYYDETRTEVYAFIDRTGDYLLLKAVDGRQNRPAEIPQTFVLEQNYPNPFNPRTAIRFALPEAQPVSLSIYNLNGQLVRILVDDRPLEAGWHRLIWDGRDDAGRGVASGVYLYRLKTAGFDQVKKMTLVR
ncbi:MAG: FlgD immunoglobulin-like domain containing protein [candidate division KSB1 bacterium]|nr:FlgD immunoglobulin-like domain containing protein [candidate division KSB1 bacterium]